LNEYKTDSEEGDECSITFHCKDHGPFALDLKDADSCAKLEYNTPLRNLIRARAQLADQDGGECFWLRVTGGDYAGYYQEQMLFHQLLGSGTSQRYQIVYAPLITDWSGVKISKSLYVKDGGYKYLEITNRAYLLSFEEFNKRMGGEGDGERNGSGLNFLFDEVKAWVDDPKRLFRNYSLEQLHLALTSRFEAQRAKEALRG